MANRDNNENMRRATADVQRPDVRSRQRYRKQSRDAHHAQQQRYQGREAYAANHQQTACTQTRNQAQRRGAHAQSGMPPRDNRPYAGLQAQNRVTSSSSMRVPPLATQTSKKKSRRGLALAIVLVLALVFGGIAVGLRMLSGTSVLPLGQTSALSASEPTSRYESPYNWQNLDRTGGRYTFRIDGKVMSRLGIDVSENQQDIDWVAVADDGIEFAIVRLGYRGTGTGAIRLDERFGENLSGAQDAGLDCGVYFFSQATTVEEAQEEADFVLANLSGVQLQYPVVYDCEEVAAGAGTSRTSGMSKAEMTACARAFCERIEAAGYHAMVYGNTRDLARYNVRELAGYPLWYAEYGMPTPTVMLDFTMWQYSNDGHVAGISTAVDMNIDLSEAYRASGR